NTASAMGGFTVGSAVLVRANNEYQDMRTVAAYRNTNAAAGDNITVTWSTSSYTALTGLTPYP
ncbi:MAG: hypothetical protein LBQ44_00390, partial [Treponema sp.]|nr:hypothetical protein [Treponema sp.]